MKKNRLVLMILIVLITAIGGGAANAQRGPDSRRQPGSSDEEISINFTDAPMIEVIDIMSRITGKNFILDTSVRGTVTVIAPTRVPKSEAYGVFESILEMNGFSLVPQGNVIKVVPIRTAKGKSIDVRKGRGEPGRDARDQIVTQLIPIRHSNAQEIATAITPLISKDATLTVYSNTNMIILTETTSNIARLLEIVREIDVPGFEEKITIIPLINAQADILAAEILQALESGGGAPGRPPTGRTRRRAPAQQPLAGLAASSIKIIADERTNSLIVVATDMDTEQVKFLVRELDKITPVEANNIHVYRLKNALAEDVAAVLTSLAGQSTPASGQPGGAAAMASVRTFYKEVSVVADKTTNALIIVASPQDYAVIGSVIDQLDIMRPQVLVETLIAEVSLDFTRALGVQWFGGNPNGQDHGFVGVNESTGSSLASNVASSITTTALTGVPGIPAIPSGISLGYFNIDQDFLTAFIELSASEGNDDFNVLSAPHILTLDNEKATINISDNVPFITSTLTDSTGGETTSQNETFEYRDVGIILEITPHISPDRMVRLEIMQKVNDVSTISASSSTGNVLSEKKREAETTVVVKDRSTLVLGGLMKDTDDVSISKVPFLGDIPILGWAFKSKTTTRKKTNLLIFITPSIVTSVEEAASVTLEKTNDAGEELQEQMRGSATMRRTLFRETGDAPVDAAVGLYEAGPK